MSKDYQKKSVRTSTCEQSPGPMAVPDVVSVAMGEIAADVQEGLLALAVGVGLQVMARDDGRRRGGAVRAAGQARCGPGRNQARQ